jgi:PAS domain S-box-containing protein
MLSGFAYCKILFEDGSPRDFIYLEVNGAFERLTGLKNVVGKKVSEVIPGIHESNPELLRIYSRVALTGKPERFETYIEPLAIWFSTSVYSPEKEYFVVVFDNITERKQAHDELRRYSEEIRDLYDNAPCGYHSLDAYGTFIRVNDTELDWLGSTRDDLVGKKKFSDFMTPESREAFKRNYPLFKEKGWIKDVEYQLTRRDGTLLPVILNATAIKDSEGNFLQSRASLFDNTERRKIEEERKGLEERLQRSEKMESLGMLAGGVAHDLNNVLGILIGYSELIAEEIDESSSIRPHIKYIQQGGERAAAIVQDLLTLARRGVHTREVVNLNAIIADAGESPELEKILSFHPGVRIKTKFDADPLYIEGSPVHLSKTLMNLISNAAEAMKAGGLLTLATCNGYLDRPVHGYDTVREGDYAILTVSDTGEGISASAMKRIFEPFYTKKVMGRSGTGLGLAVVWGTVRDHNGYINVESEEGKGTTFTLYIPATREDISGEQKPISVHEYIGNGETVLIVDDEEGQRELAYMMLKKLNYEAMTVSSGEEAVEYLRKNKVDLVVLDMIMDPGMDGLDTYKKILEIYPKQKSIIVSGFSESDRVRQAQKLGAGAYVRKPYLQERLGTAVKKELNISM